MAYMDIRLVYTQAHIHTHRMYKKKRKRYHQSLHVVGINVTFQAHYDTLISDHLLCIYLYSYIYINIFFFSFR